MSGITETVNIAEIKKLYYGSHPWINSNGIIPKGPIQDFNQPHDREIKFPLVN